MTWFNIVWEVAEQVLSFSDKFCVSFHVTVVHIVADE